MANRRDRATTELGEKLFMESRGCAKIKYANRCVRESGRNSAMTFDDPKNLRHDRVASKFSPGVYIVFDVLIITYLLEERIYIFRVTARYTVILIFAYRNGISLRETSPRLYLTSV